ncbi:MAG: CocE/NonD family hydrolase [Clostridiales bacterium]|nr:CocE/NonD family hydrolase [Clostridiales bacterium]
MGNFEVLTVNLTSDDIPEIDHRLTVLKNGSVNGPDARPLSCDILWEKDAAVTMRDGVQIYVDVYRPTGSEQVPAILSWAPYGKDVRDMDIPWYVQADRLSGLQTFEGADPGFWCAHGYAVIQADARGTYNSGGVMRQWGEQEGSDAYDCIEWIASQEWCSGKVTMSGTSWLAIIQWHTAALNPPHLACIAPWEGHYDAYRHSAAKGGVVNTVFDRGIFKVLIRGKEAAESIPDMADIHPLFDDYWETKQAKVEKIRIPVYVTASYTNIIHTHGTFDAWCDLGTEEKWLRIHNTHEWNDYYAHEEDLLRFFDHFLKGEDNGWEKTPKVRMAVLDPGRWDITDRPEADFPLPRTKYETLYLNADGMTIEEEKPEAECSCVYDSEIHGAGAVFSYTFDRITEISGYVKLRLWVAAEDAEDLELFVYQNKSAPDGKELLSIVYGAEMSGFDGQKFYGTTAWIKGSLRKVSGYKQDGIRVLHNFNTPEMLTPGEPILVELTLSPMAMKYYPGEKLNIIVGTYPMNATDAFCPLDPEGPHFVSCNHGKHRIVTGGTYDSSVTIPCIPRQ